MNKIIIIVVIIILGLVVFGVSSFNNNSQKTIACTEEAKKCSDGSSVARVPPKCEFAECPKVVEQKPVVITTTQDVNTNIPNLYNTTKLNKKIIIGGISITPLEVISDSRCPADVYCIWAGTLEIKVRLENNNNQKEVLLKLGEKADFLNISVLFKSVLPIKNTKTTIKPDEYFFEFALLPKEIIKNSSSSSVEKPIF